MGETEKIRVIVVDDSAFMRVALRKIIEEDGDQIQVIGTAKNGEEALEMIRSLSPDLVTMDVEMPVMDGLTTLKRIMSEMPLPVLMISALTEEGAEATFEALELGAVDFIPKGGRTQAELSIDKIGMQLRQKIRAIVHQNRTRRLSFGGFTRLQRAASDGQGSPSFHRESVKRQSRCQLVTIGVSTGGPMALNMLIPRLPEDFASSLLVVQHMPPTFTQSFAKRLDKNSRVRVKEAADGDTVDPGCVYIAPGGIHMRVENNHSERLRIRLDHEPSHLLFIPSVDVMMNSIAEIFRGCILGIIMTGMGQDGLEGMTSIKEKGGVTLAQEESSCVVYGMPKACIARGIIDKVVDLERLSIEIIRLAG